VHTCKETQKLATCARWVQQNGILCFVPGSQEKSCKFDTGVSKSVVVNEHLLFYYKGDCTLVST
jgi:hypothetical protein